MQVAHRVIDNFKVESVCEIQNRVTEADWGNRVRGKLKVALIHPEQSPIRKRELSRIDTHEGRNLTEEEGRYCSTVVSEKRVNYGDWIGLVGFDDSFLNFVVSEVRVKRVEVACDSSVAQREAPTPREGVVDWVERSEENRVEEVALRCHQRVRVVLAREVIANVVGAYLIRNWELVTVMVV